MSDASLASFREQVECLLRSVSNGRTNLGANAEGYGQAPRESRSPILRLSRRLEWCEPLDIMAAVSVSPALYWRSSDGAIEVAGFGCADLHTCTTSEGLPDVLRSIEARLTAASPTVKYFGGLRFNSNVPTSSEWMTFGCVTFMLPRVEVIQQGGSSYVVINLMTDASIEPQLAEIEAIVQRCADEGPMELPRASASRIDTPNQLVWNEKIRDVLAILEGGNRAEKIVLSRCTQLGLTSEGSSAAIVRELLRASPRSYGFIFSPKEGVSFIGASPERLFRRNGSVVESAALAGTTGRGTNQEHDQVLAHDLLQSRKNRNEHQLVVDSIARQLSDLCDAPPSVETTTTIRTGSVQHLSAAIRGVLKKGITDCDIIRALHPTPAVAGTPTGEAVRFIAENEGYDRGWYTGPVGYLGRDESELAVAIRCALRTPEAVRVYVGAGIVSGSDERSEWGELEAKMAPYLRLLVENERYA
jgi:menaquinone-specific isochorismate synthase